MRKSETNSNGRRSNWTPGAQCNSAILKTCLLALCGCVIGAAAQTNVLYHNDFEKAEVGKVPADFLVLDGGFAVKEEGGNKFLELPGAPLESFGVQFGPAEISDLSVCARING